MASKHVAIKSDGKGKSTRMTIEKSSGEPDDRFMGTRTPDGQRFFEVLEEAESLLCHRS